MEAYLLPVNFIEILGVLWENGYVSPEQSGLGFGERAYLSDLYEGRLSLSTWIN